MIPWRLFWLYYNDIHRIEAAERLNIAMAMMHALGAVMGGEKSSETSRRTLEEAYPHLKGVKLNG